MLHELSHKQFLVLQSKLGGILRISEIPYYMQETTMLNNHHHDVPNRQSFIERHACLQLQGARQTAKAAAATCNS